MKLAFWPNFWCVAANFFMTRKAGIIGIATIKLDGDPVDF